MDYAKLNLFLTSPSPGGIRIKRLKWAGLVIMILGSSILLFLYNPVNSWIFPSCPFRALTGFKCPGCGTLRALHQLLHGNLAAAWRLNPLMLIMLPFLGYAFGDYSRRVFQNKPLLNIRLSSSVIWLLLNTILLYWVLRNFI